MNKQKNGRPGEFTGEQLKKALFYFEDLAERIQVPFFVLKDTARDVNAEAELTGGGVDVGIKEGEFNAKGKESMFLTLEPNALKTKYGYELECEGVPIRLYIIKRRYKWFESLNLMFYGVSNFWVPNPIKKYWKGRFLVK
jgi:hypothetical protein